ncbi:hypothetical protein LJC18_04115 [Lachnospiraceae bacterium OttesenSCG-928-E19]|nr:hypothetical protein [Lachnospiraceae bacterium OttesenSCG-928-E19]
MAVIALNPHLEHRKQQIDAEKSSVCSYSIKSFGMDFREHFNAFFDKATENIKSALNWKKLNFGDRKIHIKKLVKHALNFRKLNHSVKVRFEENNDKNRGTLGATNGRDLMIYDDLLKNDNYDKVVEVCAHEPDHVFQINGAQTTLGSTTVNKCYHNYVTPYESYNHYRQNPIEVEAFEVGRIVSDDFTKELKKRNKVMRFMQDRYYQNAA